MSAVFGPVSSLPGSLHLAPQGQMCDTHPDRPAVRRVQGETDSMGCEMTDMCQECLDAHRNRDRTEEQTGVCDWCKKHATDLRSHRDFEEGQAGRVYDVCGACVKKENDELEAEREDYPYDDRDYGDE